ncbi:unnamed protein product, partial [Pleuronectes platessa]
SKVHRPGPEREGNGARLRVKKRRKTLTASSYLPKSSCCIVRYSSGRYALTTHDRNILDSRLPPPLHRGEMDAEETVQQIIAALDSAPEPAVNPAGKSPCSVITSASPRSHSDICVHTWRKSRETAEPSACLKAAYAVFTL